MKYIIFFISIALSVLVAFSGSRYFSFTNFSIKTCFSIFIFTVFTYLTVKLAKKKNRSVYIYLIGLAIPPTIILIISLIELEHTIAALPSNLAYILGVALGILLTNYKSLYFRIGTLIFCVIFFSLINKELYPKWLHKIDYGTYLGQTKPEKAVLNLNGFDENKEPINTKDFDNKVLILDFWFKGCGYCKLQFPLFKELAEKFHSSDTLFIAINYPLKNITLDETLDYLDVKDSKVRLVFPEDTSIFRKNGIVNYPSYMVINKKNESVFYGRMDMLERFLKK